MEFSGRVRGSTPWDRWGGEIDSVREERELERE